MTEIVAGQILAGGLWAAIGVGFGAIVRNQVGAIVGALIWTFVGENLLTLADGRLRHGVRDRRLVVIRDRDVTS